MGGRWDVRRARSDGPGLDMMRRFPSRSSTRCAEALAGAMYRDECGAGFEARLQSWWAAEAHVVFVLGESREV
nr:hypothetical protein CFP56_32336 [Quercus suber]